MDPKSAVVIAIMGIILGGGGVGALIPIFKVRAERESVIIEGAESAVQSLTLALQRSDLRVEKLEKENDKLRVTVEEMRTHLDAAQTTMQILTNDLTETKTKLERLMKSM